MKLRLFVWVLASIAITACSSGDNTGASTSTRSTGSAPTPVFMTELEASRFLNQATFGASTSEIQRLQSIGYSEWILSQFSAPQQSYLQSVLLVQASGADAGRIDLSQSFWTRAIVGSDQLRQRMAFALSQILVASYSEGSLINRPVAMANYMDILSSGALGNFRQTLEDITYSPAMAIWLTYLQNQKADAARNVVPDENYAREIMQLFTIGTLELQPNGELRLGGSGNPIETYDNVDVTELAKVFTGLSWAEGTDFLEGPGSIRSEHLPLIMYNAEHSPEAKSFLGTTIPANTPGNQSISIALDALFNHPNTAPFISKQLIQRFVTSNPSPDYVGRVATAFRTGQYTLPDGRTAGTGSRGDLRAVVAAILLDSEARDPSVAASTPGFGKLREPVIRFTHWARAFGVTQTNISVIENLQDTRPPDRLNQQAFRAASVFNFYRPGFVAPGTESATAGLVAPEFQITTAASVTGYANFIQEFIVDEDRRVEFGPNYSAEIALAGNAANLVDHLDVLLTSGRLSSGARTRTINAVNEITAGTGPFTRNEIRVRVAILFIMTSPDYIVEL